MSDRAISSSKDFNNRSRVKSSSSALAVVMSLATAIIHFYLVSAEFDKGATGYGTLFILTGVGYLTGTIAGYLPSESLAKIRTPARLLLIGIALASIVAYIVLGYFDTLGWVTKGIETMLVLVVGIGLSRR